MGSFHDLLFFTTNFHCKRMKVSSHDTLAVFRPEGPSLSYCLFELTKFFSISEVKEVETTTCCHFMSLDMTLTSRLLVSCRWRRWWDTSLSIRHLRRRMRLWWGSYTFFGPARRPGITFTLWRWVLSTGPSVIPTPKHLFPPGRSEHSLWLWIARVNRSIWRAGHLEPQEGERRGAIWTVWRRAQALSPRSYSRLGGRNIYKLLYFIMLSSDRE